MTHNPPRILVAEDNPALANVIRFNLERAGCSVTLIRDGAEAARRIDEERFDLVVTDLQMPGLDGEQLCRHIRSQPDYCDIPIIVCSAKGLEVDMNRLLLEYGISHILFKPFSPVELVNICASTVRNAAIVSDEQRLVESPG